MDLKISRRAKILVLVPHPDDESIGCGGFLIKYASQCDIVLFTDGANGNKDWSREKTKAVRKSEFNKVMDYLKVRSWKMMNIPDLQLTNNKDVIWKIDITGYHYILVPNKYEYHPDHKVIYQEIKKIVLERNLNTNILQYEVWSPIPVPSHYLDISEIVDKKYELIQFYKCPLMHIDYDRRILALNYYRGMGRGYQSAECFDLEKLTGNKLENIKIRVINWIKNLGENKR